MVLYMDLLSSLHYHMQHLYTDSIDYELKHTIEVVVVILDRFMQHYDTV